jgi:TATA-binding protein-associated factor Taf7
MMSRTIDIPGGTAVLRDRQDEIRVREQRIIDTALVPALPAFSKARDRKAWETDGDVVRSSKLTRQESVALMEFQDAQVIALLQSWSLPRELPDIDTIQDLDPLLYAALLDATRVIQSTTDVFKRPDVNPESLSPAEESPTDPSGDSDKSSREEKGFEPFQETEQSSNAGESTGIASSIPD